MLYDNMILKGSAVLKSRIKVLGGSHPSPERLRIQKWQVGRSLGSNGLGGSHPSPERLRMQKWEVRVITGKQWPLSGLEATTDG